MHPAVKEELDALKERFPGKTELTLDEYADYFGIGRRGASRHFNRQNSGPRKIGHKRVGRKLIIPMLDFAYWLAQHKVVDGMPLTLNLAGDVNQAMKRRRGFCQTQDYGYRQLG